MSIQFLWPEGKTKALTLSYDDGWIYDERLIGIFNRFGLKSSFHLNSGLYDSGSRNRPVFDIPKLRKLYAGHEISCHTVTHPTMTKIPDTEIIREVFLDRLELEKLAGYPVVGMSYPMGDYDPRVISILRAAGIACCRTVKASGNFALPEDFLAWHPTCHHDQALEYADKFLDEYHVMVLFMVWGHSHEFEHKGSWELIEQFARTVSGRDDVWYATNIEICRYVTAMRSLVGSADGTIYYNPSALPVWVRNGLDAAVPIAPGETKVFS